MKNKRSLRYSLYLNGRDNVCVCECVCECRYVYTQSYMV